MPPILRSPCSDLTHVPFLYLVRGRPETETKSTSARSCPHQPHLPTGYTQSGLHSSPAPISPGSVSVMSLSFPATAGIPAPQPKALLPPREFHSPACPPARLPASHLKRTAAATALRLARRGKHVSRETLARRSLRVGAKFAQSPAGPTGSASLQRPAHSFLSPPFGVSCPLHRSPPHRFHSLKFVRV